MIQQLINDEKFTNVQKAQAGITRLFENARKTKSFYRVMKNDVPLGVLVPDDMWQSLTEDIEALSSPNYLNKIRESRRSNKRITSADVKKRLGL